MPASMHAFTPTVVLALGRQGCGCLCAGLQQPQWQHRGGGRVAGVCVCICASDGVGGGAWGHAHIHTGGSVSRSGGGVAGVHALFHNRNGSTRGRQGHTLHLCQQQQWDMCTYEPLEEKEARSTHTCALAKWWWGGHGQVHAGKVELGRLWSGEGAGGLMHDSRSCSAGALQWSSAISQQSSYDMVPEEAPWLGI